MSEASQIPLAGKRVGAALVVLGFLCLPLVCPAADMAAAGKLSGEILGLVTDAAGLPQMGAAVLLLNEQDKISGRVLSDEKGAFSFDALSAGIYSIRVSLASFMPVSRSRIFVQPGLRTLLNVSLAGLFSSIQLVYPTADQRAIMSDDWKWVLRTSNATRPVLRLLPGWKADDNGAAQRASSGIFSDTRALVRLSGGDGGRVTSFGNESELGTAFALATSVLGKNQIQFSGNLGYASQSGVPSAGFRTSYSRGDGDAPSPEVTVTMRQLFVPGRVSAALSGPNGAVPVLRTLSLSAKDGTQLSDSLRLEYGFSLDAVSFLNRLNYFSPYSRLTYTLPDHDQIEFSYTSGVPRSDMFTEPSASERELQSDRLFPDVLPDLFTTSSVFNAGSYRSFGYMASVTQNLGDNLKLTTMYGSGDALLADKAEIFRQNPDDLRSMIRRGRRQSVTSQISGTSPWSGTQFSASYQWTDQHAVTPTHFFVTQRARAEAGLNIYIRQPIRTFSMVPVRMEASADLRNLLAEGYLPFTMTDGRQILLMHTPRSFRGGLTFIF